MPFSENFAPPFTQSQLRHCMGDFNIDMKSKNLGYDKLDDEFCDLFNLTNLIKSETCFTKIINPL